MNHLGKDQPELLIFTDCHGVPIGDHDVEIPGVAGGHIDNDNGAGVQDDDSELPGVEDTGDDNEEQPLPNIFEADDAPPNVPNPELNLTPELNLNEPNTVQPEPHLIEHNDETPDAPAPVQQNDDGNL